MDDIFLISGNWNSVKKGAFDMARLRKAIIEPLDELQKQAFVMLCKDYSPRMIPTKSALLKQMVWTQAVQSGALRPWAGLMVDTPVDLETIKESCEVYKRCFGLDEASLEDLAELSGINKECIRESVRRKLPICTSLFDTTDPLPQPSIRGLVGMMAKNGSTLMTLEVANYSFETTVNCGSVKGKAMHVVAYFLRKIITEQAECACALYEELFI
ncbi:interferon-gamma-inducible GTPase 10-like [Branchiostoma floridae x Branchiostoma belcheri]